MSFLSVLQVSIDHTAVRQKNVVPRVLSSLQTADHIDSIILHQLARREVSGVQLRWSLILETLSRELLLLVV